MQYQSITANAIPHRDARWNRVMLAGAFKAMRAMGVSDATHIAVMQDTKDRIRAKDAEPSAWFTGPTRAMWMQARSLRGELDGWTHEQLGRELMGDPA
jgi:hypothetical protein